MWCIGLLLLLFARIDSLQCPERCHCMQTIQPSENNSSVTPTYQITCKGLGDVRSLLRELPNPTTQLIVKAADVKAPRAIDEILGEASQVLPHLTDFSITNSVAGSQGDQLIKELLPFASITGPVPRGPAFSQLQILNLSNNTLRYLPPGLFRSCSSLQTLDLSDNLIKNLETDTFHPLINLLRLDLRRNRLQSLNHDLFRNLSKLLTMDVSHNAISRITPTTFQYLTSLNTLILAGNPLSSSLVLLSAGRHLQVVDVSSTGIHQAPTTLERTVRTLILKDNWLSAVRCGDLDCFPLLSTLYLDGNHISYVEEDAMGRLELLDELHASHNMLFQVPKSLPENLILIDLSYNLIQNLSNSDFLNLSLLKELSLNNNQIRHIDENSFADLPSLRVLDLSRNPLLALPPLAGLIQLKVLNLSFLTNISRAWRQGLRTFPLPTPGNTQELLLESSPALSSLFLSDTATLEQFANLSALQLRHSNLTTLRKDIFILLPSLRELYLEGNPWHCDREMLVTAEWVRAHVASDDAKGLDVVNVNAIHCATPAALHGKPLSQLTQNDFHTDPNRQPHSNAILGAQQKKEKVPEAQIDLNRYENSIESIDNGKGEIEKTSNPLEGYPERATPAAAETLGDNDNRLNAALFNTSVTAKTDAENLSRKPINGTPSTASPSTARPLLRSAFSESRTTPSVLIPSNNKSAPLFSDVAEKTIVSAKNLSETWSATNSSSTIEVPSHVSSRLVSDSLETKLVPSDGGAHSETKPASSTIPEQRDEIEGRGDEVPGEPESTTPDLGEDVAWADTIFTDHSSIEPESNRTGADALSALPPASHPTIITLIVLGAVVTAAFACMIQHVKRKRREEGYVLHDQEMEVHSISNFPSSEVW